MKQGISLLPEILKKEGYTTIALDWLGRFHKRGYDLYMGTEGFPSIMNRINKLSKRITELPYDRGSFLTREALRLISKFKAKSFFMFIHYWDVHAPYVPPRRFVKKFSGFEYTKENFDATRRCACYGCRRIREGKTTLGNHLGWLSVLKIKSLNEVMARYDASINFVDYNIGKILARLKAKGIYDNSIVVVTADHGECLGEHDFFFTHCGIYEKTVRIPLMIKLPGRKSMRSDALMQQIDILPTLLDAARIKKPQNIDGKSLLPLIEGKEKKVREEAVLMETRAESIGIRTDKYKYIKYKSSSSEEFYNLAEDPEERHNLMGKFDVPTEITERVSRIASIVIPKRKTLPTSPILKLKKDIALLKRMLADEREALEGKKTQLKRVKTRLSWRIIARIRRDFRRLGRLLYYTYYLLIASALTAVVWAALICGMAGSKAVKPFKRFGEASKIKHLKKEISVVIVNWNCINLIRPCLESVFDYAGDNAEVIVVDNNSVDGSIDMIEKSFPKVRLIKNSSNLGFAEATNQGIRIAEGKYVLTLNPDVIITKDFISTMIKAAESDRRIGTVSGKLLNAKNAELADSTGHILYTNRYAKNRGHGQLDYSQFNDGRIFGVCAAAALYKREMLEDIKIGNEYFDSDFFAYFEDVDLDWRANLMGWKAYFTNKAVAYHAREAKSNYDMRHFYSLKNRYLAMLKNDSLISLLKTAWFTFLIDANFSMYSIKNTIKAMSEMRKLYFRMLAKRNYVMEQKRISFREMDNLFTATPLMKMLVEKEL
jgi:GT2 family glycosyltransferase